MGMSASTLVQEHATTALAGGVVALSVLWWWWSTRRPSGLPPGPGPALPLIGHLHLFGKDPMEQLSRWRRQYGDVFSVYLGNRLVVVLNGYNVIKEALVKHADVFSDRPHMFITDVLVENKGLLATSGAHWKEQRKVALEILRELGLGKNVLAERVQEEVNEYVKAVAAQQGKAFDPRELTHTSVSNNICSIVFGLRFDYDDPTFRRYLNIMDENVKNLGRATAVNFIPVFKYFPGDLFKVKRIIANVRFVEDAFIYPQLDSHLKNYDSNDGATDFVEAYIREMKKLAGKETTLDEPNLIKVMGDLFVAGTETTATTIRWALVYFLHYPQIQEKCFQEIKRVVGTERAPTMRDRPELTYMEATIMEVLRRADIAPLSVQHGLPHDVDFMGYKLPKDAIIIPCLESVLHEPELWDNPLEFRPERFIDPEGKLVRREEFIPFSLGRRVCLGEALARTELFLYLTSMIQRFRFLPPEAGELPSLQGILGLSRMPGQFKIRAVVRE